MVTKAYGSGLEAALDVIRGKWKVLILCTFEATDPLESGGSEVERS